MNKLTDAETYQELKDFIEQRGYSNKELNTKRYWFKINNNEGRYNKIISWISNYLENNNGKVKISKELAIEYKDKYGASEAVRKLKEDFGIVITRQGLYSAIKRGE